MNLKKCILTQNDCYKAGRTITPKGVMVHSTGANNPNLRRYVQPDDGLLGMNANANDWNRSGVGKCAHAIIGKLADGSVATYQTLPWNMRGWHCGGSGNDSYIGFEICEDGLYDSSYFNAVYREAVELTAYLCKKYSLDPKKDGVIICHADGYERKIASNHGDVLHWFQKHGKNMDDFRNDVAAEIKTVSGGEKTVNVELPILKKGSKSASVKSMQRLLVGKGYDTNGIDGSFGPGTDAAVRSFQKASGLVVDGYCGAKTWHALLTK